MNPMPESLPRYSLLDLPRLTAQAAAFKLPPESIELLVAIDRVLRSGAAAGILGPDAAAGWALAGPTALHGVYLRSSEMLRIPEALVLAPIASRDALAPAKLAALLATALPNGGAVASPEPGSWNISYLGNSGSAILPLVLERAPLSFEVPESASGAERAEVGYLYDRRMPYLPRVAQTPVAVPVAYAEELILRLLGALAGATANRPDVGARVDDLRLLLALEASDTRDALAGPVHAALVSGLRQRGQGADAIKARLDAIGAALVTTVTRWSDPDALPAGLRPTGSYGPEERRAFEAALDAATGALSRGSR